ncbi:MAG: hypothetical protein COB33_005580 [Thiotrichaceae bacterium]|nr:hypothetical protein [Thiotrichaceae bacterium]
MSTDADFSSINYQFLLKARDVAKRDPDLVVALLGIPRELVEPLAHTSASALTSIIQIREPLLILRAETWWWERLLKALNDGRQEEIDAVLEHACFVGTSPQGGND